MIFKKDKFFLGLDIGTEAVKAFVFKKGKDPEKIIIIGSSVNYFRRPRNEEEIFFTVKECIENIYKKIIFSGLEKRIKKEIEKQKNWDAFLIVSSDLLKIRIFKTTIKRESNLEIKAKEKKIIYNEVLDRAKNSISSSFTKENGIFQEEIIWVSFLNIERKINGYRVKDILGYKGKELEISIIVQFMAKRNREMIERSLKRLGIEIFSLVNGAPFILKKLSEGQESFLDIGGEITDLFFFDNGVLKDFQSFNEGGKMFTEKIAEVLGVSEQFAREFKTKYSLGDLSNESCDRIREIISSSRAEWFSNLRNGFFSNPIFFGGGVIPDIKEIKKSKILMPKDLDIIENPSKILIDAQYTPLLLSVIQGISKK